MDDESMKDQSGTDPEAQNQVLEGPTMENQAMEDETKNHLAGLKLYLIVLGLSLSILLIALVRYLTILQYPCP